MLKEVAKVPSSLMEPALEEGKGLDEMVSVRMRLSRDVLDYVEEEAGREGLDRSAIIRRLVQRGIAESGRERAELYVEGRTSISGAETAGITIPEMVEFLVRKGYGSGYSLEDFRRGVVVPICDNSRCSGRSWLGRGPAGGQ